MIYNTPGIIEKRNDMKSLPPDKMKDIPDN